MDKLKEVRKITKRLENQDRKYHDYHIVWEKDRAREKKLMARFRCGNQGKQILIRKEKKLSEI